MPPAKVLAVPVHSVSGDRLHQEQPDGGRPVPGRDGGDGGHQQGLFLPHLPQRNRDELFQVAEHDPPGKGDGAAGGQRKDPDRGGDAVRVPEYLQFQPRLPRGKGHGSGRIPGAENVTKLLCHIFNNVI